MRVAPLRIRADRLAELRRILGDDVEVTETTLTEPDAVEAIARSIVADAVVIDVVAPPVLPGLVAALGGYTLLRPLFEHIRTSHDERQPVFTGYAALTPQGGLERLPDGALGFRTDVIVAEITDVSRSPLKLSPVTTLAHEDLHLGRVAGRRCQATVARHEGSAERLAQRNEGRVVGRQIFTPSPDAIGQGTVRIAGDRRPRRVVPLQDHRGIQKPAGHLQVFGRLDGRGYGPAAVTTSTASSTTAMPAPSTRPSATPIGCSTLAPWPPSAPSETASIMRWPRAIIGLYKTECVRPEGPWRGVDDLELGTLNWVHWFNETRLHSSIGYVPPIEFEAAYYRQINAQQQPLSGD